MQGWKTWTGVAGLAIGGGLVAVGMTDTAQMVYAVSVPMVVVGIGSKMDKILRGIATAANSAADELEKATKSNAPAVGQVPPSPGGPDN